ncbi:hypothetical protein Y032_0323g2508 [Ancylostoma ceylanicum]|uniref:Uncharacterized protein n=1 Tax=Ancylostoma ceylanicum TaxID=53326 RepID=A0A016S1B4_9BILA|nr:hypothetical protein Y032_0323g2508 [Ancylostoma ceylanicum]
MIELASVQLPPEEASAEEGRPLHNISTHENVNYKYIMDAAVYAKSSKIRWAGHVMRLNDHRWTRAVSDWTSRNVKRTTGRPPTRWSDFFTKSFKERYDTLRVSRTDRTHWTTLARERDKWKDCWRPLGLPDDQRESR